MSYLMNIDSKNKEIKELNIYANSINTKTNNNNNNNGNNSKNDKNGSHDINNNINEEKKSEKYKRRQESAKETDHVRVNNKANYLTLIF